MSIVTNANDSYTSRRATRKICLTHAGPGMLQPSSFGFPGSDAVLLGNQDLTEA